MFISLAGLEMLIDSVKVLRERKKNEVQLGLIIS